MHGGLPANHTSLLFNVLPYSLPLAECIENVYVYIYIGISILRTIYLYLGIEDETRFLLHWLPPTLLSRQT